MLLITTYQKIIKKETFFQHYLYSSKGNFVKNLNVARLQNNGVLVGRKTRQSQNWT